MKKFFGLSGTIALAALVLCLLASVFSCEAVGGGTLILKNNHNVSISVTITSPKKVVLYKDVPVEAGKTKSFSIDEDGTYKITSDKNDAMLELVSGGIDSSISFPVALGYDKVIEIK